MADVFVCRLQGIGGFDKEVVVKRIIPEHAGDTNFVKMFLDEARVAANLNHPNIVQVFEINEADGIPYIAMEYVKGVTLGMVIREAHRQKNVHYGHCTKIIAGICEALDYAHNAVNADGEPLGLVHRDVSPGNIVISREGVPKLLDFGVAKANNRLAKTEAGTIKGKFRYMAPEQVQQAPVDNKADIFSAGVCLFELTTGRNPFGPKGGDEVAILKNIVHGVFAKPSEIVPTYPADLEAIVLSAIDQDPSKRCPSARELRDRLEAFASTGEHASNPRDLVKWLHTLFPNFGSLTTTGRLTAFTGVTGTTPVAGTPGPGASSGALQRVGSSGDIPVFEAGDGSRSRRSRVPSGALTRVDGDGSVTFKKATAKWAALGAVLVLGGGALAVKATRQEPPPPAPAVVNVPVPVTPSGPSDDQAGKAYLDAADDLVKDGRLEPALDMVAKAVELKMKSPELNIRLARLRDSLQTQALLRKANNHLKQNEWRPAIETAKQALDRDADNADALKIIAAAKAGERPQVAAPAPTGKAKEKAKDGTLTITSNPPGMVYVDDEPIGRSPISRKSIPVGKHTVQVRAPGYRPSEVDIKVGPGQPITLVLPLVPEATAPSARPTSRPSEDTAHPKSITPPPAASGRPSGGETTEPRASGESGAKPASLGVRPPPPPSPPPAPPPAAKPASASSSPPPAGSSGPVVSATPKSPVPAPALPRSYTAKDPESLARVCQIIESSAVSLAGVTPEFARGITGPLRRLVGSNGEIYPVAVYYFIVREAALKHDNRAAASNLAAAQSSGAILKFKNLPATERSL